MRILPTLSALMLAGAATTAAQNNSFCTPSSGDVQVAQYVWALEWFVQQYYASVPVNQTFLSSALNSSNANYVSNLQGIDQQNRLGVRAAQQLGKRTSNFTAPGCNFTFPAANSSEVFLTTAQAYESNVSAALVGLAGYTQAPEVSFLIARLAAQHAGHAAYLATTQEAVVFESNVTSLVRAYDPNYVLSNGTQPGQLGRFFKGCVSAPQPPCGNLTIGPLIATPGSNSSSSSGSSSSTASSSSASGTATIMGSSRRNFW
ncbi:hypothetical protein Asppvi_004702 [Aspergillus pseudoviridinutans]|uniref:Ferritin-like domain-containing protein n=1 Tax=Aspergillus pseudoviridinutans TaxID=1517512 RepID=A0A9P3EUA2_9EURO|nr:uncharacterized protein Asppvi_004702 [Aspergillus pseudoviridinutans]GIJ85838.1 hypothetical protein Asppvi_004702 [Aspergillus pseudoviridinutans]